MEVYVARRFRILRKLAQTPYSRLYIAEDVTSHKTVVLKLESRNSKYVQLPIECEFYKRVRNYIGIYFLGFNIAVRVNIKLEQFASVLIFNV